MLFTFIREAMSALDKNHILYCQLYISYTSKPTNYMILTTCIITD